MDLAPPQRSVRCRAFPLAQPACDLLTGEVAANLPVSDPSKMNFGGAGAAKAWKEIWGCGQGIGVINKVQGAAEFVAQLKREYAQARARLAL